MRTRRICLRQKVSACGSAAAGFAIKALLRLYSGAIKALIT